MNRECIVYTTARCVREAVAQWSEGFLPHTMTMGEFLSRAYVSVGKIVPESKRDMKVKATIYTKNMTKQLELDLEKYNAQYPTIKLKKFDSSHDRFLLIDEKEVYHIGASLKDLGKKWFAFSKLDMGALNILEKLNNE